MGMWIGRNRKARVTYGFDEMALVPGDVTVNPNEVDCSFAIGKHTFKVPILASAREGVVDLKFAVAMVKRGGLGVLDAWGDDDATISGGRKSIDRLPDRSLESPEGMRFHNCRKWFSGRWCTNPVHQCVRKRNVAVQPLDKTVITVHAG